MDRPDHVKCVLLDRGDVPPRTTWCGLAAQTFDFLLGNADHAAQLGYDGTMKSITVCPECADKIIGALQGAKP